MPVPDAQTSSFNASSADNERSATNPASESDIPNTYVPARNTIFLSYALAVAEVTKANHIVIGVSSVDYSGYPDCRPEFIEAFEKMANLATKAGVSGKDCISNATANPIKSRNHPAWLIFRGGLSQTVSCMDG